MEKAKIKASQFFVLVVLFEMGSAIVVSLGAEAKQDAWIAILLGMAGGLLLYLVYHRLYMYYPDIPLTSYVQKIAGKLVGRLLAFLYIVYFIYIATRVLRDFGELLVTAAYQYTPLFIINTLMILTIVYGVYKGFEVLARAGELFWGVTYLLAVSGFILIVFSGLIHLENLKPMLENGWKPVLKTAAKQTLMFPFGEMIVFGMLLPYLNEPKKALKFGLAGIVLSGVNIALTMVINVAVLGTDLFERSPFPLLNTISKIEIARFLERLDVLFMLYLVIGGFFKVAIFFYAAVLGTADLFQFKDQRKLCFPIGLIILFSSIAIASNFSEHIKEGLIIVPIFVHWPLQVLIPVLLLVIAFFRNRKKKKKSASAGNSQ